MKNIDLSALPQSTPQSPAPADQQVDANSSRAERRQAAREEFDNASIAAPKTNVPRIASKLSHEDDAKMDIRETSNRENTIDDPESDLDAPPDSVHSKASSGLKRRQMRLHDADLRKTSVAFEKENYRNWRGNREPGAGTVDTGKDVPDRMTPDQTPADNNAITMPGKRRRDLSRSELLGGLDYSKVLSVGENTQKRRGRTGLTDSQGNAVQDDSFGAFENDAPGLLLNMLPEGDVPDQQEHMGQSHRGKRNRSRDQSGRSNGVPIDELGDLQEQGSELTGRADRVHYLAMVAAAAHESFRPITTTTEGLIKRVGPQSRAECEKRCGPDGFCDPSSILGCGGEHCGKPYLDL